MSEQKENIERVGKKIAGSVIQYWRKVLDERKPPRFHMEDLTQFVQSSFPPGTVAPGSASRILRDLRRKEKLDYEVISRRNSLYEAREVLKGP